MPCNLLPVLIGSFVGVVTVHAVLGASVSSWIVVPLALFISVPLTIYLTRAK